MQVQLAEDGRPIAHASTAEGRDPIRIYGPNFSVAVSVNGGKTCIVVASLEPIAFCYGDHSATITILEVDDVLPAA